VTATATREGRVGGLCGVCSAWMHAIVHANKHGGPLRKPPAVAWLLVAVLATPAGHFAVPVAHIQNGRVGTGAPTRPHARTASAGGRRGDARLALHRT
jgi:hypothetical protein